MSTDHPYKCIKCKYKKASDFMIWTVVEFSPFQLDSLKIHFQILGSERNSPANFLTLEEKATKDDASLLSKFRSK